MRVLENLEPSKVFYYFEEICKIPHTSHHEEALSDYCADFAAQKGFDCQQDEMGNLLITVPTTAGYENADTIILQGHLDMVGAKTPDCPLNLEADPVKLLADDDFIRADGTTLGGDDGIAVAFALAILDSDDIPHPKLEIILTVCEEVGLLGASGMDLSSCSGRMLINLDSEEEGILTAGCSGGRRALCDIPVRRSLKTGIYVNIRIHDLAGGHSGADINLGRANANILMGRFLLALDEKFSYGLLDLAGGEKENVIPNACHANLIVNARNLHALEETAAEFRRTLTAEFGTTDPDIKLTLDYDDSEEEAELVLTSFALDKILTILNLMPNGVLAMCADLPSLVETSCNMGVIKLENENFLFHISIRSSLASAKEYIASKIKHLTTMMDGQVKFYGDYPAWPYAKVSPLRDRCVQIYKKQYGREPEIRLIHAGLECGILSSKIDGLDCISFGPNLYDIHTANERMSISSVQRVWEYLKEILAYLPK